MAAYFDFYNLERLHHALDYRAPRQVFEEAVHFAKLRCGRKAAFHMKKCSPSFTTPFAIIVS